MTTTSAAPDPRPRDATLEALEVRVNASTKFGYANLAVSLINLSSVENDPDGVLVYSIGGEGEHNDDGTITALQFYVYDEYAMKKADGTFAWVEIVSAAVVEAAKVEAQATLEEAWRPVPPVAQPLVVLTEAA